MVPPLLQHRLIKANKSLSGGLGVFVILQPQIIFSMEYSRIVAVTGMSGLYEILSSKSDGGIVRSLEDGSAKFVSSRVRKLSHLESIEIYTTDENVALADVFN